MYHEAIEAQGFQGRIAGLRSIKRWKSFSPAWYRHDLEMHTLELRYLLEAVAPHIRQTLPGFNFERAGIIALVHDDPEIVSKNGDVELNVKLNMSPQELVQLEQEESEAIKTLLARWPQTVQGYNYQSLLEEAKKKATIETQVLSYLDKCSALCESLHELYAGNNQFHHNWRAERKRPPYAGTNVAELVEKYTLISPFFAKKHPFLPPFSKPDVESLLKTQKPHTSQSLTQPTGLPQYDFWKATILKHAPEDGARWLTEQREV
ncbi:hypothetical protein EXS73_01250 [Candidatus Pacearchaeota archaeon]|nr:hypothetical protein [Candidatus Pacearchaeota archaeon]